MTKQELKAFCELLMNADPTPLSEADDKLINDLANREAQAHGYDDWIEAFHDD